MNIEGGTIDIVLLYGAMLTINGGTINSFDNYCNYGGETVITGGTFDLGNGPFFYCWFNVNNASAYGEDWDSIEEWESHGYIMVASAQYSGWYEVYTNDATETLDLADGYSLVDNQDGTWTVK